MSFFKYIKPIGTGPKSNRDLSFEETKEAIELILEQKCEPEQAAVFLMLLRNKLESDDELKGCLEAFHRYVKQTPIKESIELGYSYDGKTKQPYLFPLVAKELQNFFENNKTYEPFDLIISGDELQPAKSGLTVKNIADMIELPSNVHYFDRKEYFKELSNLTVLRKKLYMRTMFNTVEKLLNPACSKYAITSAFHKPYVRKYLDLFASSYEEMMIIKGSEGAVEVYSDFRYWIEEQGEIVEKKIKFEELGIVYTKEYENITLEQALDAIKNPSEELQDVAKLNAAILLFATKRVQSIEEGYALLKG